jgi:hypothetical protein
MTNKWRVDFYGHLMDADHASLSGAGVFYEKGGSEVGPNGEIREGYARNVVLVDDAADAKAAIQAVKDALGPGPDVSEFNANPA